jgi:serine/threonine-protein kinase
MFSSSVVLKFSQQALLEPGEIVSNQFQIRSLIGGGRLGQVFEAFDQTFPRRVALKVAWPTADAGLLRQEAQALASVRHPGVASVYCLGQHRGLDYFAMELIRGVPLDQRIHAVVDTARVIGIDDVLDILVPLASALAAVHHAGLEHGNLSPSDVVLAPGERVFLLGVGAPSSSRVRALKSLDSRTLNYTAPEITLGQVEYGQGGLGDVYSLGVVAFELLTGTLPFEDETVADLMARHFLEAPAVIRNRHDVPPALSALLSEMLATDPYDRPPSIDAVVHRLRAMRRLR